MLLSQITHTKIKTNTFSHLFSNEYVQFVCEQLLIIACEKNVVQEKEQEPRKKGHTHHVQTANGQ